MWPTPLIKKLVNGHLTDVDEDKAVAQLNNRGYQVISIKSFGSLTKLNKSLNFSFGSQVKPKENYHVFPANGHLA